MSLGPVLKRLLFHNFRRVYRFDNWVRRHFTQAGLLVLGALITAGVFGIDTRQTQAYQIFSLACALLLLAALASLWFPRRFNATRSLPRFGTLGEPLEYRVTVDNASRQPQRGLWLEEHLHVELPGFEDFLRAQDSADQKRNWFDRQVGYPRWLSLIRERRGADTQETALPPLPPGGQASVRLRLLPLRRGYIYFTGLDFARPDPLGLFKALYTCPCPGRILVLPRLYPLPHLSLPGRRKYQHGGVNLAMSVGDAVEFVALREYRPGDALRHMHWKSCARLGKPIVKEFQDEFFVRRALILDTFAGPRQNRAQFEGAVSVAASFAGSMFGQDALLDFLFVGTEAYSFTGGRGLAHLDSLLEILACVDMCHDRPFDLLHGLVAQHSPALSGAVCVLLEWDAPRRELVRLLRDRGLPLLLLLVTDTPHAYSLDELRASAGRAHILVPDKLAEGLKNLAI